MPNLFRCLENTRRLLRIVALAFIALRALILVRSQSSRIQAIFSTHFYLVP